MILHESAKVKLVFNPRNETDNFAVVVKDHPPLLAISYAEALRQYEELSAIREET